MSLLSFTFLKPYQQKSTESQIPDSIPTIHKLSRFDQFIIKKKKQSAHYLPHLDRHDQNKWSIEVDKLLIMPFEVSNKVMHPIRIPQFLQFP